MWVIYTVFIYRESVEESWIPWRPSVNGGKNHEWVSLAHIALSNGHIAWREKECQVVPPTTAPASMHGRIDFTFFRKLEPCRGTSASVTSLFLLVYCHRGFPRSSYKYIVSAVKGWAHHIFLSANPPIVFRLFSALVLPQTTDMKINFKT